MRITANKTSNKGDEISGLFELGQCSSGGDAFLEYGPCLYLLFGW